MTNIPTDAARARTALIATAQDAHHYLTSLIAGEYSVFDPPTTLVQRLENYRLAYDKLMECATFTRASLCGEPLSPRLDSCVTAIVDMPSVNELVSVAHLTSSARAALRKLTAWMKYLAIDAEGATDLTQSPPRPHTRAAAER